MSFEANKQTNYWVAVDFDGTIVDHVYPGIGQPVPGALDGMREIIAAGGNIILLTMRANVSDRGDTLGPAWDYLVENGIMIPYVNFNPTQHEWTNSPKVYASQYIDDNNAGCPLIHPEGFNKECVDWSKVLPSVLEHIRRRIIK